MSTLFSRRPGKGGRLAGLGIGGSTKNNKFGTGISNTDLQAADDFPRSSVSSGDARPLNSISLRLDGSKQTAKSASKVFRSPDALKHQRSLPATAMYDQAAADDFGRMQPAQTKAPRAGLTLPLSSRSINRPNQPSQLSPASTAAPASYARLAADVPPPPAASIHHVSSAHGKEAFPYGYTHEGWDTEMTQDVALQIVELCGTEIRARGLDAPLIFSSMALDLSAGTVASLIRSFLASDSSNLAQSQLAEEVRYANPHTLAAMIKWTLARLGRFYAVPVPSTIPTKKGEVQEEMAVVQQRGWLEIDWYLQWRDQEKNADYPWTSFSQFCHSIEDEAAALLRGVFSLLSSTTSYSHKNGMTPSKLARLFGVVLFGLPEDETFARAYDAYTRASNATEHLFLAYIRDLAAYEVLPVRLMSHIEGYPHTLSTDFSKPARHVRTVPITQIERQVRMYAQDLIQTACELELSDQSEEWAACCSANEHHGKDPQLSDRFRKLINLRGGSRQGRRRNGQASSAAELDRTHSGRAKSKSEDPSSYTSVAQEEWGNFLSEGFTEPDSAKLSFDLRESERKARSQKRGTVAWSDFANMGFNDRDDGLAAVLSFDDGLREGMEKWPGERAELLTKLRETAAKVPPFPYDSTPRVIARPSQAGEDNAVLSERGETIVVRMDDVFAEVWADFLIGNGWANRDELTHRTANFVVVQYKSRPHQFTVGSQGAGSSRATAAVVPSRTSLGDVIPADDRADAAWFVVQEIVPSGYRADLEAAGRVKSRSRPSVRKLNVFRKLRRDKTGASSLAGGNGADKENDNLFPPGTKRIALNPDPAMLPDPSDELDRANGSSLNVSGSKRQHKYGLFHSPLLSQGEGEQSGSPLLGEHGSKFMTALRAKTLRGRKGLNGDEFGVAPVPPPKVPEDQYAQTGGFKNGLREDSFSSSDFETRSLHDPDDAIAADAKERLARRRSLLRHNRRESKDDAWIDIMMRTNAAGRMNGQDATATPSAKSAKLRGDDSVRSHGGAEEAAAGIGSSMLGLSGHNDGGVDEDETDFTPVPTPTQERSPSRFPSAPSPVPSGRELAPPATPQGRNGAGRSPSPRRTPEPTSARKPVPDVSSMLTPPEAVMQGRGSPLRKSPRTSPSPVPERSDSPRGGATSATPLRATPSPDSRPRSIAPEESPSIADTDEEGRRPSDVAHSMSPTSSREDDLNAFPAPPADVPGSSANASLRSSSPTIDTSKPILPNRSALRPVSDNTPSEPTREERVSAAVLRARELRAKLQPVNSRRSASGSDASVEPAAEALASLKPTSPAAASKVPRANKIDPFAKNPTSGKVASIAARFGAPPTTPGKLSATSTPNSPGSSVAKSPPASPSPAPKLRPQLSRTGSGSDAGSTPPLETASAAAQPQPEAVAPAKPKQPETQASEESQAQTQVQPTPMTPQHRSLTEAALATLPSEMFHPDMPPSPRHPDSVIMGGDHDSLYPDDAASNYSRSTEDSASAAGDLTTGATTGTTARGWDKATLAQHMNQQALQSAFLEGSTGTGTAHLHEGTGKDAGRFEEEDSFGALPPQFREPYQPGQPLENVFEESESMLSGSNC